MKTYATTRPRPFTAMRRSWQNPRDVSKVTKSLQKEIDHYSSIVSKLSIENNYIKKLTHYLNEYKTGKSASPFLKQHFRKELEGINEDINSRAEKLLNIEREVKSTRVIFGGDLSDKNEKNRLLLENKRLVDLALFLEQLTIVEKMKLRMNHDLRDYCKYKRFADNILKGNSVDFKMEDQIIKQKKATIAHLKRAIEYERYRIAALQSPQYEINDAAIVIQKHWRGYLQRKKGIPSKDQKVSFKSTPVNDSDEYYSEYSDEESVNEQPQEDDDVFKVTGVLNPDDGTNEENQTRDQSSRLAPADAKRKHRRKHRKCQEKNSQEGTNGESTAGNKPNEQRDPVNLQDDLPPPSDYVEEKLVISLKHINNLIKSPPKTAPIKSPSLSSSPSPRQYKD